MTAYKAPVADFVFTLRHVVGFDDLAQLPAFAEAGAGEVLEPILEEAAKFTGGVLAPLNRVGDKQGARLENGIVRTADGFADAYRQFAAAGWGGVPFPVEVGGQGLPWALSLAVSEMAQAANLAFGLGPMLTQSAIEALIAHGNDEQKQTWLPKLVSGEWTGTMNLTEPQAGSDLGQVRCRAERQADGTYRLFGQKIFITWGDHDCAANIVHLVLARLPDAPAGVKGISLFIVPKFLLKEDGSIGARNDVKPVSLEHKLGIHGSPTCVMAYGDDDGAVGYVVGEENRGLEYMFTMMNNARINVGVQGVAIADRAYQHAVDYARTRLQGRSILPGAASGPAPIIQHPDVRRMLLTMKALTEAARALALIAGRALDEAHHGADAAIRAAAQRRADVLTPLVKAWGTEIGNEVASLGVQIHGGMGFIEETGAAQYYRDARILPIYEGTNGIQANDLAFRKTVRDQGQSVGELIAWIEGTAARLADQPGDDAASIAGAVRTAAGQLRTASDWVLATGAGDQPLAAAASWPFLQIASLAAGGATMAEAATAALQALASREGDPAFLEAKIVTARFFAEAILPRIDSFAQTLAPAARTVLAMPEAAF